MKTAISIPDPVFRAAERAARRLGISRSQLYATAVGQYLERLRRADVTDRLDAVYGDEAEGVPRDVARAQAGVVAREDW